MVDNADQKMDLPPQAIDLEKLLALVAVHLNVALPKLQLIPITTGKHNSSFWVVAEQQRWVLRVATSGATGLLFYERRMMRQEPLLHELIRSHTTIPVAQIIVADFSRAHVDRDYLLMTVLPVLDDVVASGCYTVDDRQFMSNLLEQHISHFDYAEPARLLHMDVWSQNILVDSAGNVTGLVDFDRALWGDPEIEFAVLDYCNISDPAFWQGYGRERNYSTAAQIRQQFYLLYELQKYMPISIWRRQDEQRALSFKQQCFALANPLQK